MQEYSYQDRAVGTGDSFAVGHVFVDAKGLRAVHPRWAGRAVRLELVNERLSARFGRGT